MNISSRSLSWQLDPSPDSRAHRNLNYEESTRGKIFREGCSLLDSIYEKTGPATRNPPFDRETQLLSIGNEMNMSNHVYANVRPRIDRINRYK
jgi:hypothetical protein